MADLPVCRNCGHIHPTTTKRGASHIAKKCDHDGCGCVSFKFDAKGLSVSTKVDPFNHPGAAQAVENQTLRLSNRELRSELLKRVQDSEASLRALMHRNELLVQAIKEVTPIGASLATITAGDYSSYTHPAVVNGVKQLNDKLTSALVLADASAPE